VGCLVWIDVVTECRLSGLNRRCDWVGCCVAWVCLCHPKMPIHVPDTRLPFHVPDLEDISCAWPRMPFNVKVSWIPNFVCLMRGHAADVWMCGMRPCAVQWSQCEGMAWHMWHAGMYCQVLCHALHVHPLNRVPSSLHALRVHFLERVPSSLLIPLLECCCWSAMKPYRADPLVGAPLHFFCMYAGCSNLTFLLSFHKKSSRMELHFFCMYAGCSNLTCLPSFHKMSSRMEGKVSKLLTRMCSRAHSVFIDRVCRLGSNCAVRDQWVNNVWSMREQMSAQWSSAQIAHRSGVPRSMCNVSVYSVMHLSSVSGVEE